MKVFRLTSKDPRSGAGGALLLLSWFVGGWALMGLGQDEGQSPAAVLFVLACVLWFLGRDMVTGGGKLLRFFSFFVPAMWFGPILSAVFSLHEAYGGWFAWLCLLMVVAVVGASCYRGSRRRAAALRGGESIPPPKG